MIRRALYSAREILYAHRLFPDSAQRNVYSGLLEGRLPDAEFTDFRLARYGNLKIRIRSTEDDARVIDEVFGGEAYRCPVAESDVRNIVDLGGHIGLGALYFLLQFPAPSGKLVVLEPDHANYALLQRNLAALDNGHAKSVAAICGGIWSQTGTGQIAQSSHSWGHRITEGPGDVPLYGMADILERHEIDEVDILKVDVEGAEKAVFGDSCASWIKRVKRIYIELHDGTEGVDRTLRDYGFRRKHRKGHPTWFYLREDAG